MVVQYSVVQEALRIASGKSDAPVRRAHLQALVQLIESLKVAHQEREEVIALLLDTRQAPQRQAC